MKNKKIVLIFSLILLICSLFIGANNTGVVFASSSWENRTENFETTFLGSGTTDDPYQISNAQELADFAYLVNNRVEDYFKADYRLSANIVLNTGKHKENQYSWKKWTPIGNSETNYFSGSFDGAGFVISGIAINNTDLRYAGLFGYLKPFVDSETNATTTPQIYNVTINNSYIKANMYVGGIVGFIYTGNVSNSCIMNSYINGTSYVGGIAGRLSSGEIANCYANLNSDVIGTNYVGSIVGFNNGNVNYCYYYAEKMTNKGVGGEEDVDSKTNGFNASSYINSISGEDSYYKVKVRTLVFSGNSDTQLGVALNSWIVSNNDSKYCVWANSGIMPLLQKEKYVPRPTLLVNNLENVSFLINNGEIENDSVVQEGTVVSLEIITQKEMFVKRVSVQYNETEEEIQIDFNGYYTFSMPNYDAVITIQVEQYDSYYINSLNEKVYNHLQDSINTLSRISSGGTINLATNSILSNNLNISGIGAITLDFNGYNLIQNSYSIIISNPNVTLKNSQQTESKIINNTSSNGYVVEATNSNVTIENISISSSSNGLKFVGGNVTINNAKLDATNQAITFETGNNLGRIALKSTEIHTIQSYAMEISQNVNVVLTDCVIDSYNFLKTSSNADIYNCTATVQNQLFSVLSNATVNVFSGVYSTTNEKDIISNVTILGGYFSNNSYMCPFDSSCLKSFIEESSTFKDDKLWYSIFYDVVNASNENQINVEGVRSDSTIPYGETNCLITLRKLNGYVGFPETIGVYKNNELITTGYTYDKSTGRITLDEIDGYYTFSIICDLQTYSATFNVNGGTSVTNKTYNLKTQIEFMTSTKDHYRFAGWKVNSTVGNWVKDEVYNESFPLNKFGDVIFNAVWEEKKVVDISSTQTICMYLEEKGYRLLGENSTLSGFTILYKQQNGEYTTQIPSVFGAYDVRITREEDENYREFSLDIPQGYVFIRQLINVPNAIEVEYNGTEQTAQIQDTEYYVVMQNASGTNAGTYTITLKLIDFDNFQWYYPDTQTGLITQTCSVDFIIKKATNEITGYRITGKSEGQTLTVTANAKYGEVNFEFFRVIDSNSSERLDSKPTTAGKYFVKMTVLEGDNYLGVTKVVEFEISTKSNALTIILACLVGVCLIFTGLYFVDKKYHIFIRSINYLRKLRGKEPLEESDFKKEKKVNKNTKQKKVNDTKSDDSEEPKASKKQKNKNKGGSHRHRAK